MLPARGAACWSWARTWGTSRCRAGAARSTRYVAVEPHPVSWRICRDNLALNGVTSVRLLAAVADPTVSTVSLHVPADQLATPTVAFLPDNGELPPPMARDVRVRLEVAAVDVRGLLDGADLLKLDVEGRSMRC